ncbi:MAG TPA: hypothetical protein VNL15_08170 [Dehalococcoidia bacterium]|nr:hypothetical protein [Dehalococcoidia bacterium]
MERAEVLETSPEAETQCRHHWIIDTPHGAISMGRCKLCGERKEFFNSAPGAIWEDDSPVSDLGRWGRGKTAAVAVEEDDSGVSAADAASNSSMLA